MTERPKSPYYITNDADEPVRVGLEEWSRWMTVHERQVGDDTIAGVRVSTVFLGIDHAYFGGPPVLWETMLFGSKLDQTQERYTSRAAALAGHARWCNTVRETMGIGADLPVTAAGGGQAS